MTARVIHQFVPNFAAGDAIGAHVRHTQRILRDAGFVSEVFYDEAQPAVGIELGGGQAHGPKSRVTSSSPVTRRSSSRATCQLVRRLTSALRASTRLPSASTTSKLDARPRW